MLTRIPSKFSIFSWCLYDWANSSYSSVIITYIFSAYFTKVIASNTITGTAQWGLAIAFAGIIIAILSPLAGAIADKEGRRKPWVGFFTLLMVVSASCLWFAKPSQGDVYWTLEWVIIGCIGMEMSMVFYNAMLNDLAPQGYLGRISGWAWGLGYLGSLACLIFALLAFVQNDSNWLGLNKVAHEHIRICGPLVSLWIIIFSLPFFIFTPDRFSTRIKYTKAIKDGCSALYQTLKRIKHSREILRFLIAQMLYADGINTILAFGGIYAAGTFGMSFTEIIKFGIAMNVAAGLGAILFAWIDDWIGPKRTIVLSLIIMIIMTCIILIIHQVFLFWIYALILAFFVGPVQAASRSLMVYIAPPDRNTEMFGLFALSGKITSFVGPWVLSIITYWSNSQRIGMITVVILLLAGLVTLIPLKIESNKPAST